MPARILLVDDEPALLSLLERFLERAGYEVRSCSQATEAAEAFRQTGGAYDLIIADLSIPEMAGGRLLLQLFAVNPRVPVLICSGYPYSSSDLPAQFHEQIDFLQKPFLPNMLTDAVERIFIAQKLRLSRGGASQSASDSAS